MAVKKIPYSIYLKGYNSSMNRGFIKVSSPEYFRDPMLNNNNASERHNSTPVTVAEGKKGYLPVYEIQSFSYDRWSILYSRFVSTQESHAMRSFDFTQSIALDGTIDEYGSRVDLSDSQAGDARRCLGQIFLNTDLFLNSERYLETAENDEIKLESGVLSFDPGKAGKVSKISDEMAKLSLCLWETCWNRMRFMRENDGASMWPGENAVHTDILVTSGSKDSVNECIAFLNEVLLPSLPQQVLSILSLTLDAEYYEDKWPDSACRLFIDEDEIPDSTIKKEIFDFRSWRKPDGKLIVPLRVSRWKGAEKLWREMAVRGIQNPNDYPEYYKNIITAYDRIDIKADFDLLSRSALCQVLMDNFKEFNGAEVQLQVIQLLIGFITDIINLLTGKLHGLSAEAAISVLSEPIERLSTLISKSEINGRLPYSDYVNLLRIYAVSDGTEKLETIRNSLAGLLGNQWCFSDKPSAETTCLKAWKDIRDASGKKTNLDSLSIKLMTSECGTVTVLNDSESFRLWAERCVSLSNESDNENSERDVLAEKIYALLEKTVEFSDQTDTTPIEVWNRVNDRDESVCNFDKISLSLLTNACKVISKSATVTPEQFRRWAQYYKPLDANDEVQGDLKRNIFGFLTRPNVFSVNTEDSPLGIWNSVNGRDEISYDFDEVSLALLNNACKAISPSEILTPEQFRLWAQYYNSLRSNDESQSNLKQNIFKLLTRPLIFDAGTEATPLSIWNSVIGREEFSYDYDEVSLALLNNAYKAVLPSETLSPEQFRLWARYYNTLSSNDENQSILKQNIFKLLTRPLIFDAGTETSPLSIWNSVNGRDEAACDFDELSLVLLKNAYDRMMASESITSEQFRRWAQYYKALDADNDKQSKLKQNIFKFLSRPYNFSTSEKESALGIWNTVNGRDWDQLSYDELSDVLLKNAIDRNCGTNTNLTPDQYRLWCDMYSEVNGTEFEHLLPNLIDMLSKQMNFDVITRDTPLSIAQEKGLKPVVSRWISRRIKELSDDHKGNLTEKEYLELLTYNSDQDLADNDHETILDLLTAQQKLVDTERDILEILCDKGEIDLLNTVIFNRCGNLEIRNDDDYRSWQKINEIPEITAENRTKLADKISSTIKKEEIRHYIETDGAAQGTHIIKRALIKRVLTDLNNSMRVSVDEYRWWLNQYKIETDTDCAAMIFEVLINAELPRDAEKDTAEMAAASSEWQLLTKLIQKAISKNAGKSLNLQTYRYWAGYYSALAENNAFSDNSFRTDFEESLLRGISNENLEILKSAGIPDDLYCRAVSNLLLKEKDTIRKQTKAGFVRWLDRLNENSISFTKCADEIEKYLSGCCMLSVEDGQDAFAYDVAVQYEAPNDLTVALLQTEFTETLEKKHREPSEEEVNRWLDHYRYLQERHMQEDLCEQIIQKLCEYPVIQNGTKHILDMTNDLPQLKCRFIEAEFRYIQKNGIAKAEVYKTYLGYYQYLRDCRNDLSCEVEEVLGRTPMPEKGMSALQLLLEAEKDVDITPIERILITTEKEKSIPYDLEQFSIRLNRITQDVSCSEEYIDLLVNINKSNDYLKHLLACMESMRTESLTPIAEEHIGKLFGRLIDTCADSIPVTLVNEINAMTEKNEVLREVLSNCQLALIRLIDTRIRYLKRDEPLYSLKFMLELLAEVPQSVYERILQELSNAIQSGTTETTAVDCYQCVIDKLDTQAFVEALIKQIEGNLKSRPFDASNLVKARDLIWRVTDSSDLRIMLLITLLKHINGAVEPELLFEEATNINNTTRIELLQTVAEWMSRVRNQKTECLDSLCGYLEETQAVYDTSDDTKTRIIDGIQSYVKRLGNNLQISSNSFGFISRGWENHGISEDTRYRLYENNDSLKADMEQYIDGQLSIGESEFGEHYAKLTECKKQRMNKVLLQIADDTNSLDELKQKTDPLKWLSRNEAKNALRDEIIHSHFAKFVNRIYESYRTGNADKQPIISSFNKARDEVVKAEIAEVLKGTLKELLQEKSEEQWTALFNEACDAYRNEARNNPFKALSNWFTSDTSHKETIAWCIHFIDLVHQSGGKGKVTEVLSELDSGRAKDIALLGKFATKVYEETLMKRTSFKQEDQYILLIVAAAQDWQNVFTRYLCLARRTENVNTLFDGDQFDNTVTWLVNLGKMISGLSGSGITQKDLADYCAGQETLVRRHQSMKRGKNEALENILTLSDNYKKRGGFHLFRH